MHDNNWEIKFPLTIEKQLERYYMNEQHTERHAVLWHTWNQNRRWITQLLQITLCSYPSYSKHDESHAQSVLHNIEMILGEERIAELSASDCFVLLHTVYIHDIGMCITHQDREDILKNRAFIDMISELEGYEESSLHHVISALQKTEYSYEDEEDWVKKAEKLYLDKLEVYYALIQLIGDFRRKEHGEKSKERLYDWVKKPDRLGSGFSLAGMPQRIFLTIANCARMHTHPDFDAIMELPQEDDGYVSDYIHPRFISVLLQLGDLLDMDNNRFHPLMQMCMGNVPETSQQHFEKHMSIRKLHITPDKIEIEADCDTQEALRLVRRECDMLKSILKDAGYSWSVICPPGYKGALPTIESVNLYMQGKRIPEELVTTQFKISQQKAFSILEGANVYPAPFVFIREFLQNALDATKLQYWNDCISAPEFYKNRGIESKDSPYDLKEYASADNYPIEIDMEIMKKTLDGKINNITKTDIEELDLGKEIRSIYGVKVCVKDFGTGIDKDSILNISKVGSSRKKAREIIEKMPEWLRPTAEFGIGLQSAFLLVGSFSCYTRTRSGERYEITFGSGSSLRYDGYINVKPVEKHEILRDDTYGTCFEIFVPCSKKNLHKNCLNAWNGEDPFSEKYERRRPLRHAAELISQMSIYINDLVGELLFPLHLNIVKNEYIKILIKENLKNIQIKWKYREGKETKYVDQKQRCERADNEREWILNKKSWIFYKEDVKDDNSIIYDQVDNDIYLLDCKSARLHIWSGDMNAFLTISARNLLKYEKGENTGVKIYYKGIKLQTNQNIDSNIFIEYIDLKGDLKRELLNLSRKGFTDKGNKYFEEVINPGLQKTIQNILKALEKDEKQRIKQVGVELQKEFNKIKIMEKQEKLEDKCLEAFCQHVISALVLVYLANCSEFNLLTAYGIENEGKSEIFDELMRDLVSLCTAECYNKSGEQRDKIVYNKLQKYSLFFNICAYDENMQHLGRMDAISIVDFFDTQKQFAILQMRESTVDRWCSYLILIDNRKGRGIHSALERLIFARNKKREDSEVVERWAKRLIKNANTKINEDEDFEQQFLLNWILRNIPTIAMLSDKTGNIRINVLSMKIFPYIYMNDEFKILIFNRMIEKYRKDRTERFSTIAWQNREYLICDKVPFSAFFVKRGKLAHRSYYKVIFPISGYMLCQIQDEINGILCGTFVQNIYKALNVLNIQKYLQLCIRGNEEVLAEIRENRELFEYEKLLPELRRRSEYSNIVLDIYETFSDTIDMRSQSCSVMSISESMELLSCSREEIISWHKIYLMVVKIYLQRDSNLHVKSEISQEIIRKLKLEKGYEKLCKVLYFFVSDNWRTVISQYVETCLEAIEYTDINRGRVIDFINENAKYPISKENIEICYNNFEKEIILLFKKSVQKEVEAEVQKAVNIWIPTDINR